MTSRPKIFFATSAHERLTETEQCLWRNPCRHSRTEDRHHGQGRGPFTHVQTRILRASRATSACWPPTNAGLRADVRGSPKGAIGKMGCLPEDRDLAADATFQDGGSPYRGADAWTEEESGLMMLTDNAALLSSFGKRKSKKAT